MSTGTQRTEGLDPQRVEATLVVSHPMWVLGAELMSPARVVYALK